MKFGLLGYPLGHSFSQRLFSSLRENFGLEMEYQNFEMERKDLENFLERAKGEIDGFNVTVPYKEEIIPYLDELSEEARGIGSVNVVKVERGKLLGHNTDWIGFISPLKGRKLNKIAFLYGAGGGARACLYGIWHLGFEKVFLTNRTFERAKKLGQHFSKKLEIIFLPFEKERLEEGLRDSSLVINSTPLGMWPRVSESPPLPEMNLSGKLFYDLIYNPLETFFLKRAKSQGAEVIGGMEMFLVQAAENLKFWLGREMEKEVRACYEYLPPGNPTEKGL